MSSTHPVQRGQRYRRALVALTVVGVGSFFVGAQFDQFLAGLVVYAIAALGLVLVSLYAQFSDHVQLMDERDRRLHEQASHAVVNVFAYVGIPTFVGIFLLDATGRYPMGPTVTGVLYAFSAFYLVWGLAYVSYRYRS
jgi:uncharacterized membrane protein